MDALTALYDYSWYVKGVFRDLQVCSETRKPPLNRIKIVYKIGMYENFSIFTLF